MVCFEKKELERGRGLQSMGGLQKVGRKWLFQQSRNLNEANRRQIQSREKEILFNILNI